MHIFHMLGLLSATPSALPESISSRMLAGNPNTLQTGRERPARFFRVIWWFCNFSDILPPASACDLIDFIGLFLFIPVYPAVLRAQTVGVTFAFRFITLCKHGSRQDRRWMQRIHDKFMPNSAWLRIYTLIIRVMRRLQLCSFSFKHAHNVPFLVSNEWNGWGCFAAVK